MVVMVGTLTLVGWTFGIHKLINFVPGTVAIKANTGLAFLLIGSALLLLQISSNRALILARTFLLFAGAIGLLTLFEYTTGWNIGIDELLFLDTSPLGGLVLPGRPLPNMALCIVLSVAGYWLMSQPVGNDRRPLTIGCLGAFVATIGVFTGFVYFVGFVSSYELWHLSGTPIQAAVILILLGASLLDFARRESQIRWVLGRKLSLVFSATSVLLLAGAIYSHRNAIHIVKVADWMQHTHEVNLKLSELRGDLDESQSAQRGYILTGNESFLLLASNAEPAAERYLAELLKLTEDNLIQQQRLVSLKSIVSEWFKFSESTIDARRTLGFEAAVSLITSGHGKALMDQIRVRIVNMKEAEERLRLLRQEELAALTVSTISILPIATALSFVLLAAGFLQVNATAVVDIIGNEALRESEDRFRTMADAIPQLVWIAEPNGHITWYNQRWYDFTGTTPEAMVGWGWKSVHDPELLPLVMERWTRAIANEVSFEMEFPLRAADGQFCWFLTRAVPLKNPAGKLLRWFGTNTDVSQKRKAEEEINRLNTRLEQRVQERTAALQAANNELSDLKAAMDEHSIVIIMDPIGKVTYVNSKFSAISGYSREELLGRDDCIVNSKDFSEEFSQDLWQTISGGRVWRGEIRKRAKNGAFYWADSTIVPFYDTRRSVTQYIAICSDITRRKLVEEALSEGEERLRLATAVAGVAVWSWDIQRDVVQWDELMFALYGMKPTRDGWVSYKDWQDRVLPEDFAEQEAVLKNTVAKGGSSQREFRIVRASDQAVRIIQAAEVMVARVDASAMRMVGVNIDITERRHAEAEIAKLNLDLQRRSHNLELANKELEAFSYSVSHDLRTPLRAVDGFSMMVFERFHGQLGEEGRRMLSVVRSETRRMGQLIDDLLAFCRIGRQEIESVEVDMRSAAQEVFDELASLEPKRKLQLNLHPLPATRGVAAMLRQVWVNLIGNAIKFTKGRDVGCIEIDAWSGEDGEQIYSVKDNGVGFDMRYVGKLFGVFQRLHALDEFPGTGVGLAIASRILQRHGGRIWAEAELDKGATFTFALPNQEVRAIESKSPQSEGTPPKVDRI